MVSNLTDEVLINAFKKLIDPNIKNKQRLAGFLEAGLMKKGHIRPGTPFEYKTITRKVWFFKLEYKENYVMLIRRLCEEFFNEKEIEIPTLDKK